METQVVTTTETRGPLTEGQKVKACLVAGVFFVYSDEQEDRGKALAMPTSITMTDCTLATDVNGHIEIYGRITKEVIGDGIPARVRYSSAHFITEGNLQIDTAPAVVGTSLGIIVYCN